jgi:hypothetical protein
MSGEWWSRDVVAPLLRRVLWRRGSLVGLWLSEIGQEGMCVGSDGALR